MPANPLDALPRVIDDVVAPAAVDVDRNATYPAAALAALGEAGILGLTTSRDVGGSGAGLAAASEVVERLAQACGSTAMVVLMHYAATALIEAAGPTATREAIAAGSHVTTLAFSESGSRSHFWAPLSSATAAGDLVRLDARKSWVTSAGHADSYVWSSQPLTGGAGMSLWLVPSGTPGLTSGGDFDGLGLRGNASRPVNGDGVVVAGDSLLGEDGGGFDLAMATVLPWFLVLNASFSLGLMEAVTAEATAHASATRLEHLDRSLAADPVVRAEVARLRIETDRTRAFLGDTVAALARGRDDAMLRVLEVKAVAAEAAIEVTDRAMKVCGGAAFRRDLGVERRFRDSRAARVMAPTTDALWDFVGRLCCGLPLFDDPEPATAEPDAAEPDAAEVA